MAIDASSSMLANDLKPNRLEALKNVAIEFVNQRINDRVGLVIYATESYTRMPVTSDKGIVISSIRGIDYGNLEDGTAIGMGLSTAVNRLKTSKSKSKVIILLTDGMNNSGFINPKTATQLALGYNIKVYTIGIGTNGMAKTPIAYRPDGSLKFGLRKVEIDEALLKSIAQQTNGKYFRAKDNKELKEIYNEIDKLEKTELKEFRYYNYEKKYRIFTALALILILLEVVARYTLFKSFI
ncbi:Ca-activated chloride channel family protein [Elysia marginata]|uniref:Ca-activated chloride channel family protein n=1 Tax=Elysia marginata TaxID=1093978 RepID=A0AAV4F1D3_9GAST|nr:Ca-activated chloride channel family protein [Elysia marginata]